MSYRIVLPFALAAALAGAFVAGEAKADPYAEYNRHRAYRLFLTSPSPYRTYSSATPGYVRDYSTPFAYGREWQTPSYLQERITPYGYERRVAPPRRGGWVAPRPVVVIPPS